MSGFSFGAPPQQAAAPAAAGGGFSFGAPKTAAMSGAFGAPAAAPPPTMGGLSFAAPPSSAASTLGTGSFNFGAPATSIATAAAAPGFGFGAQAVPGSMPSAAPAAAPAFSFGTPAANAAATSTAAAVPTLGLGLGGATTMSAAAQPTQGFGGGGGGAFAFGKQPTTTTSVGLSFGTSTSSATSFSAGGGLFGKSVTTTVAATAPTPFIGLGGVDVSSTQPKAGDSKQDNIKVKETQVPEEIAKTVNALKTYIKAQKTLSSDIGRTSTSKLSNVSSEIMNLQWSLQEIANAVESNYNLIKLMRKETSKTIQSVEMAQRTQDTPAGLQFENTAPFQYFQNLVFKYEHDLINFRQQIALTEKHMHSLTNPQNVSPEDLKRGFQQINESFISLAGRLQEIHQKVEAQKEQFLNLRKYRLRDSSNVFAKLDNPEAKVDNMKITSGPTPFSNISAMSSFGQSFANSRATGGNTTGQTTK